MSREHKYLRFIYTLILVMWLGTLIYLGFLTHNSLTWLRRILRYLERLMPLARKSNYGFYLSSF